MKSTIKMIVVIVAMMVTTNVFASDMCNANTNNDWSKGNYRVVVTNDAADPYKVQMKRTVTYTTGTFTTVIDVATMPNAETAHTVCVATQAY